MRTTFPGNSYARDQVRSADGTVVGYRWLGSGPAVLLLHGGMQAAQHLMRLGEALAGDFTVCLPDRRGRGRSGPAGDRYGMAREVEDVQALAAATGASRIFGHSAGALVALRSALQTPALERIALYEPPLSVDGSAPVAWVPRYEREIAAGRSGAAMITALKGLRTEPAFARLPRFLLTALLPVGRLLQRDAPGDVPVSELIPAQRLDMRLVREMSGTLRDYADLRAGVLLLGGDRGPGYLDVALGALADTVPHARRLTFPGLGHSGPDNDGDPRRVAEVLRDFFRGDGGAAVVAGPG